MVERHAEWKIREEKKRGCVMKKRSIEEIRAAASSEIQKRWGVKVELSNVVNFCCDWKKEECPKNPKEREAWIEERLSKARVWKQSGGFSAGEVRSNESAWVDVLVEENIWSMPKEWSAKEKLGVGLEWWRKGFGAPSI